LGCNDELLEHELQTFSRSEFVHCESIQTWNREEHRLIVAIDRTAAKEHYAELQLALYGGSGLLLIYFSFLTSNT
jgi:hypothetical protein